VRPGDAPTILGLFNAMPTQSPAGLTGWDQALLESLYHADPRTDLRRTTLVRRMVDQIVSDRSPESHTQ